MKVVLIFDDTPKGVHVSAMKEGRINELTSNDETMATKLCSIAVMAVQAYLVNEGIDQHVSHLATNADGKFTIN